MCILKKKYIVTVLMILAVVAAFVGKEGLKRSTRNVATKHYISLPQRNL